MKILWIVTLVMVASAVNAAQTVSSVGGDNDRFDGKYPPVLFVTNIPGDELKSTIEGHHVFAALDEKSVGYPIAVRVFKNWRTSYDATRTVSDVLAGATLGLLPRVSHKEFEVRYDVFVQGDSIATFRYALNSTDVENVWARKDQDKLNDEQKAFVTSTIPKFLNDVKASADVQAVFKEYWEYFGE